MSTPDLTGRWAGFYRQRGTEHPIAADLRQDGGRLVGAMWDAQPRHEHSVFDVAAEAGLPPGADEQIVARLRELVPDAAPGPVRHVQQLPPEAALEGTLAGRRVALLKTYQGVTFDGYRVGDRLVGLKRPGHAVHYEGDVDAAGDILAGLWWIAPEPGAGGRRLEGEFELRRVPPEPTKTAGAAEARVRPRRWWEFWRRGQQAARRS